MGDLCGARVIGRGSVLLGSVAFAARFVAALLGTLLVTGCMCIPRTPLADEELADRISGQIEKLPLPGIYEMRVTAAGGHVTLGGRVDSPETAKEIVTAIASTPGVCELSFYGLEFSPPCVSDNVIAANARIAASKAIGETLASKLGYYCEDHFLIVYGTLPSLAVREKLEEAMRGVPGVGRYHVSCEIVLADPSSDQRVVADVRRKFRRPFELPNLVFRASQIEVTSKNNVVHLSGRAPSYLGKLSAGAQAAQVKGVRYVVNHIQVPGVPPPQRVPNAMPSNQMPANGAPAANGQPDPEKPEPAVP